MLMFIICFENTCYEARWMMCTLKWVECCNMGSISLQWNTWGSRHRLWNNTTVQRRLHRYWDYPLLKGLRTANFNWRSMTSIYGCHCQTIWRTIMSKLCTTIESIRLGYIYFEMWCNGVALHICTSAPCVANLQFLEVFNQQIEHLINHKSSDI